jgi:hypothetical protein
MRAVVEDAVYIAGAAADAADNATEDAIEVLREHGMWGELELAL